MLLASKRSFSDDKGGRRILSEDGESFQPDGSENLSTFFVEDHWGKGDEVGFDLAHFLARSPGSLY